MVRSKRIEFVYDSPWEVVVLAYEDKFWRIPNDDLPDVLEVKFLDFHLDVDTQQTSFKRWGRFRMAVPQWILKMAGGPENIILSSETVIDRRKRLLRSTGGNTTFRNRIVMNETTTFQPHPDDPNKTLLTLEGEINIKVSLLGWVVGQIENAVLSQYVAMTGKGREIEKSVVARLVARFKESGEVVPMTKSEQIARSMAADAAGLPKLPAGAAGLPSLAFPIMTPQLMAALGGGPPPGDDDGDAEDGGGSGSGAAKGSGGGAAASAGAGRGGGDSGGASGRRSNVSRRRSLSGDPADRRSRGLSLEDAMADTTAPAGAVRALARGQHPGIDRSVSTSVIASPSAR